MGSSGILGLIVLLSVVVGQEALAETPDANAILINSINSAAGMELIPKDTRFELKSVNGLKTYHKCEDFAGGGRGCVSGSVYASKASATPTTATLNLVSALAMPFVTRLLRQQ